MPEVGRRIRGDRPGALGEPVLVSAGDRERVGQVCAQIGCRATAERQRLAVGLSGILSAPEPHETQSQQPVGFRVPRRYRAQPLEHAERLLVLAVIQQQIDLRLEKARVALAALAQQRVLERLFGLGPGQIGEIVALLVLERLRTIAPEDPETHRLLATCFMGLGRAQDAVEAYRRALALDKGPRADLRAHLAYALSVAGRNEEGLAECARAIAADPKAYLGHFVRGWILGELGRGEEERREYLEAVRLEKDDADLWAQLALSWEEAGERARAREAWREVVRIDPSDEEAAEKVGAKPKPLAGRGGDQRE